MTIAFVLGNGVSRRPIALDTLKERGKIYGCNALYRDFIPDVLVATDRPIATRIQEEGYSAKNVFYTRRPIAGLGGHPIPQNYYGFSSGPAAVGLAASASYRTIYLLGFDLGPSQTGKFNNVYSDTEFYKTSQSNSTYTGNWIRQIVDTVNKFPHTKFVRVKGATTANIIKFDKIQNLTNLPIQDFLDLYK